MTDTRQRLLNIQRLIQENKLNQATTELKELIRTPLTQASDLFWAGLLAQELKASQPAAYLIQEAIKLEPNAPNYLTNYGRVLSSLQQYTAAEEVLKQAIQMEPQSALYPYNLAEMYFTSGDFEQAKTAYHATLSIDKSHLDALIGLANIANFEADNAGMRKYLETALRLMPKHPIVLYLWSLLLKKEDNIDGALNTLQRVFEIAPQYYVAWYEFGMLLQEKQAYPEALTAFSKANQYHDRKLATEQQKTEPQRLFDTTCSFLQTKTNNPPKNKHILPPEKSPIFITGFPRSGSSLLSSMLDQHPKLHAAGELSFLKNVCLLAGQQINANNDMQRIYQAMWSDDNEALVELIGMSYQALIAELKEKMGITEDQRIIDKSPFNVPHFPVIARITPNSTVINIIRDGREASWSCFTQNFKDYHWYTHACVDAIHEWAMNIKHARHYAQLLNLNYYEIHYEALIENPERELSKLLDFMGLDWNDACLHHQKTSAPTLTASYDQVKQPLYTSSLKKAIYYPEMYAEMTAAEEALLAVLGYL